MTGSDRSHLKCFNRGNSPKRDDRLALGGDTQVHRPILLCCLTEGRQNR